MRSVPTARSRRRREPPEKRRSGRLCAARVHVNGVERGMPADVEAIPRGAAETDIGDLFRNGNLADESAIWRDAVNAVARACPKVAVDIDPEAVRDSGRDLGEHAAFAELAVRDLEGADVVRPVRIRPETGIRDVEKLLVGRKGEAVRAPEVVCDNSERAVARIEAIDVAA